ncbi:MAG: nucleotidyltransferase family protein [Gemmatirosa sp.]|nr:nucleotidyltransferase family protein [Gemmatirosa sp.]
MKAVILAAGRGTRMREPDPAARLTPEQSAAADRGAKAMMPIHGRPFLDHALGALADAGVDDACLVVGPEHDEIGARYGGDTWRRPGVRIAVQERPLGSADAVLAAEPFAAGEPFIVVNGDNLYPAAAVAALLATPAPATLAFARAGLLRDGAIPAERIAAYAILDVDVEGIVRGVLEKPSAEVLARFGDDARVSMNCWLFDARIFDACRAVPPSPRGELELAGAVQVLIDVLGARVRAVPVDASVLDLSRRGDVAVVESRLDA